LRVQRQVARRVGDVGNDFAYRVGNRTGVWVNGTQTRAPPMPSSAMRHVRMMFFRCRLRRYRRT
jgi:hypothetical protein